MKPARLPDKPQWKHLFHEVIAPDRCTGCAACVVACPHDVLDYKHADGGYIPFNIEDPTVADACSHGDKGCTLCTRACPRFRDWEIDADTHLFGKVRSENEVYGQYNSVMLVQSTDQSIAEIGQDGGLVSALLIYALENNIIDGALVSEAKDDWTAQPAVATTREEVLACAGSRYTYSANTLAYKDAEERGLEKLALVGMGCQASAPAIMKSRRTGKSARRLELTIGLMCSKTFTDAIFEDLFKAKYGVERKDIKKFNIKGRFHIWTHDGRYIEIPLKECHEFTRPGCKQCPDFSAEHADISTGGIVSHAGWTLTVVRTKRGRALLEAMIEEGWLFTKDISEDPNAMNLLIKLSTKQRERWTERNGPGILPSAGPLV
jgi:coenzyme F420 hydrogenase subunit beta